MGQDSSNLRKPPPPIPSNSAGRLERPCSSAMDVNVNVAVNTQSQIQTHPLTQQPTDAWTQLKNFNTVRPVTPLNPDTPVIPDFIRFVCISDTHALTGQMPLGIPAGDVLIHAGDFTNVGRLEEVKAFNEFLGSLPHKHKIVIAGNHELTFDPDRTAKHYYAAAAATSANAKAKKSSQKIDPRSLLTNCTYLEDSGVELWGLKIFGVPWQPEFGGWAFNLKRGEECLKKWQEIPADTDILITHGPPLGHGDLCKGGVRAGCVEMLEIVQAKIKPKFHIFGHIHEGYGVTTNGVTTFINASICTLNYEPTNPPIVFDVPLPPGIGGKF